MLKNHTCKRWSGFKKVLVENQLIKRWNMRDNENASIMRMIGEGNYSYKTYSSWLTDETKSKEKVSFTATWVWWMANTGKVAGVYVGDFSKLCRAATSVHINNLHISNLKFVFMLKSLRPFASLTQILFHFLFLHTVHSEISHAFSAYQWKVTVVFSCPTLLTTNHEEHLHPKLLSPTPVAMTINLTPGNCTEMLCNGRRDSSQEVWWSGDQSLVWFFHMCWFHFLSLSELAKVNK